MARMSTPCSIGVFRQLLPLLVFLVLLTLSSAHLWECRNDRSSLSVAFFAALVHAVSMVPSRVDGVAVDEKARKEAEALLEQKRRLPAQGQEEEQAHLLKRASDLNPQSTTIFQEIAVLQIQRLLRTKAADDPAHPFLLEALQALDALDSLTAQNKAANWGFIHQLLNFGHQAEGKDRPLFAQEVYEAAVRLNPEHGNAVASLYKIREWLCMWEGREAALADLLRRVQQQLGAGHAPSLQPLVALSQEVEPSMQLQVARAWVKLYRKAEPQENLFFRARAPPPVEDHRLSLAYLSGDLRGHAVSHQMLAVFHAHASSSKVRVIVLNTFQGNIGDQGREIQRQVHAWYDLKAAESDEGAAARIVNEVKAHIVVEMSGHTGGHRLGVLSLRPAPLALSFLGYPASTGADFVDYFLSDATASPPELSPFFAESLALLPFSFYPFNTRQSMATAPSPAQMGLPNDPSAFVFANFNRNLKIKPDIFQAWCSLVSSSPRRVLWLRRFHRQVQTNLQLEAVARGVPNASVVFAGRFPNRAEHLARHRLASLFLDTPRFGGHSTLADVLWAGVPAVVLPGSIFASRVGASMLLALGASPFVSRNLQDYVSIAEAAARPSKAAQVRLQTWRERVFQRMRSPRWPFETAQYTARLETVYRTAWETFRARRYLARNGKGGSEPRKAPTLLITA